MTITATATQLSNTTVKVEWATDEADPAIGFAIDSELNPPGTPLQVGLVTGTSRLFIDEFVTPVTGDIIEYVVTDEDTTTFGTVQITLLDLSAAQWATIADVRTMLGPTLEPHYSDAQITTAITNSTARLASVFCKEVAVDDVTGLPTDINVEIATTTMASRVLVTPAGGIPPVQGGQITSERIGSYSYSVRPGTSPTSSGPYTIDGLIKDLVGGYICPGYAGIPVQTDIWPYEAPAETVDVTL